ncbi:lipoprotein-34 precursor (NlpB) [Alkanindiges sp. WGS2144]|uniref:lipoprotein-34 precursor (NlpB) n=1 Tax=Alkanindiges sp. WGS2144 TaxID=3366808 RepID=UPI003751DB6F
MLYRAGLVLSLSIFALTGCSRLSISNNSLDYKETRVLPPLQLPASATRPMTSIYPAPAIDPAALDAAPNFSNKKGNRFEMPAPQGLLANAEQVQTVGVGAPSRPVLVTDGNGFPLLRIEGDPAQVWDLLLASLSVSNIAVEKRNQAAGWVAMRFDQQMVYLRLTHAGSLTTITVQDEKNLLVDKNRATDVLTQVHQNWPA